MNLYLLLIVWFGINIGPMGYFTQRKLGLGMHIMLRSSRNMHNYAHAYLHRYSRSRIAVDHALYAAAVVLSSNF